MFMRPFTQHLAWSETSVALTEHIKLYSIDVLIEQNRLYLIHDHWVRDIRLTNVG
jgi:hypothetical protein